MLVLDGSNGDRANPGSDVTVSEGPELAPQDPSLNISIELRIIARNSNIEMSAKLWPT